jgi:hypothetical protein
MHVQRTGTDTQYIIMENFPGLPLQTVINYGPRCRHILESVVLCGRLQQLLLLTSSVKGHIAGQPPSACWL